MIGWISMHVFEASLCLSGDNFFESPKYFTTGPNKLYLVSNSFVLFFSYCTGFWLEWLLGVRRREHEKKGWRERKDGMGLRVEGQASIEGVDGPLRRC